MPARVAALAQFACHLATGGERAAEKILLPFGATHQRPEALVLGVRQTQRVPMRQQPALARKVQHRRVAKPAQPAGDAKVRPNQKVAVAADEE